MSGTNATLNSDHPIQEMMSRTGSFPVHVAHSFISRLCSTPSIVFDPFCGKGTTLLAARLLGHNAYGLDIAPEAVICAAAKLGSVALSSFTRYLHGIHLGSPELDEVPESVLIFFEPSTLKQVLSLRNRFLRDRGSPSKRTSSLATFGLGCLLGILHGHASYSLSLPSAHAFSMAPRYVAHYAKVHSLSPPSRDVKACLVEKASALLRRPMPKAVRGDVRLGCARSATDVFPQLAGRVDLIVTSPPYLSAQTYAKDNWLRLWLLGHDYKSLKPRYIETGSITTYRSLMTDVFRQCASLLRLGGHLVCVAGDVRHKDSGGRRNGLIFETGNQLSALLQESSLGFSIQETGAHSVNSTSRYFHSLSKSNGHARRAITERYFIALRADP